MRIWSVADVNSCYINLHWADLRFISLLTTHSCLNSQCKTEIPLFLSCDIPGFCLPWTQSPNLKINTKLLQVVCFAGLLISLSHNLNLWIVSCMYYGSNSRRFWFVVFMIPLSHYLKLLAHWYQHREVPITVGVLRAESAVIVLVGNWERWVWYPNFCMFFDRNMKSFRESQYWCDWEDLTKPTPLSE